MIASKNLAKSVILNGGHYHLAIDSTAVSPLDSHQNSFYAFSKVNPNRVMKRGGAS
jgi:hypothetical protein